MIIIIIIILIAIIVYLNTRDHHEGYINDVWQYGEQNIYPGKSIGANGMLKDMFYANPVNLVCSKNRESPTKHMRITHSGGVMYTSYNPPDKKTHRIINCPPLVVDLLDTKCPNSRNNIVCWEHI